MNLNIFNGFNLNTILGGFSKSLNVLKKSIPVYKEVRPYIYKEKSLFKKDNNIQLNKPKKQNNYNDNLTFFN